MQTYAGLMEWFWLEGNFKSSESCHLNKHSVDILGNIYVKYNPKHNKEEFKIRDIEEEKFNSCVKRNSSVSFGIHAKISIWYVLNHI